MRQGIFQGFSADEYQIVEKTDAFMYGNNFSKIILVQPLLVLGKNSCQSSEFLSSNTYFEGFFRRSGRRELLLPFEYILRRKRKHSTFFNILGLVGCLFLTITHSHSSHINNHH
uniref:Uncharacterized protein n=1 Tax=Cacopsylla melanoneura TaxID=428564 RepID=A0A8D9F411_9HEMI